MSNIMEYNFSIESIGIIIGSIATVIGGVWFVVYRAFNFGKTTQRIDEIEKRTAQANCESNKETIEKLKECNLPQRIKTLENKVSDNKCESHDKSIEILKESLNDTKYDFKKSVESLKESLNDTKYDFRQSVESLKDEIHEFKQEFKQELNDFKQETRENFSAINKDLNDFKQETRENFFAINKDLSDFKQETRENISNLKKETNQNTDSINSLKKDVSSIIELLTFKHKDALKFFALKHSPLQLNDFGKQLIEEIKGINFINENKDFLISKIEKDNPRTALDVETSAFMACIVCCSREEFDYIKDFVYNSPEYTVKDKDGRDMKYNLSLADICFVLSIPLRDMYLGLHPEIKQ